MNRIKSLLKKAKVDAILISNIEPIHDSSFFAFSGIKSGTFLYSSLLLYKNKPILLVSEMEESEAKKTKLKYKVIKKLSDIKKFFPKIKTLGINAQLISVFRYKKIPFKKIDVAKLIKEERDLKTNEELINFKHACLIVDNIAENIPSFIKEGMTEEELAEKVDESIRKLHSSPSFDTIVAFGKNSAIPHHTPSKAKLKKNQIILIDFGAKYKNICSDMTRCFFYGSPSPEIVHVYNMVLEVQKKAINQLKQGMNGKSIYQLAKTTIEMTTKGVMNHSLGHGIGYDVHESPTLSSIDYTLKSNLFTTVEPGCYIENKFGVRIEDCVVIRKNKPIVLTKARKDLVIIPAK